MVTRQTTVFATLVCVFKAFINRYSSKMSPWGLWFSLMVHWGFEFIYFVANRSTIGELFEHSICSFFFVFLSLTPVDVHLRLSEQCQSSIGQQTTLASFKVHFKSGSLKSCRDLQAEAERKGFFFFFPLLTYFCFLYGTMALGGCFHGRLLGVWHFPEALCFSKTQF